MSPIPGFFNPKSAYDYNYAPKLDVLLGQACDYRKANHIARATLQKKDIRLLIIDGQKDFCFSEGNLFVGGRTGTGANEDNIRLARFVYSNISNIKKIVCTLDTHESHQIFFPSFFIKADGSHPSPFQVLKNENGQIVSERDGILQVNPEIVDWLCAGNHVWAKRQILFYMDKLAQGGRYGTQYALYLWPNHCQIGMPGHALAGILAEAVFFHSYVRSTEYSYETKGQSPWTENYSVLSPEVLERWDGRGLVAEKNQSFIDQLISADYLIIAGQAMSHCVKSSIDDLLYEIVNLKKAPELAKKVYILRDCTSAVVAPGYDFTPDAEAAFARFATAGMNLVDSTTPMDQWPGFVIWCYVSIYNHNMMDLLYFLVIVIYTIIWLSIHPSSTFLTMNSQTVNLNTLLQAGDMSTNATNIAINIAKGNKKIHNLGIVIDDIADSEVVSVYCLVDDSGSIAMAGNTDNVILGFSIMIEAFLGAKKKSNIIVSVDCLNDDGNLSYPYSLLVDQAGNLAIPLLNSSNYNPSGGTPLYDRCAEVATIVLAKIAEIRQSGMQERANLVIISDGQDLHSRKSTASDVRTLFTQISSNETNSVYAVGIKIDGTDFEQVFTQMGVPPQNIFIIETMKQDPEATKKEFRRKFQTMSQSMSASATGGSTGGFGS